MLRTIGITYLLTVAVVLVVLTLVPEPQWSPRTCVIVTVLSDILVACVSVPVRQITRGIRGELTEIKSSLQRSANYSGASRNNVGLELLRVLSKALEMLYRVKPSNVSHVLRCATSSAWISVNLCSEFPIQDTRRLHCSVLDKMISRSDACKIKTNNYGFNS
ncbi:unnamed protein product, partial [Dicrocoelium dendriticum]